MKRRPSREFPGPRSGLAIVLALAALSAAAPAFAQQPAAPAGAQAQQPRAAQGQRPQGGGTPTPLANLGGNSRDPIKIDADRLDVRDKESMAIFSGNVVAVQGKTTIRCSKMTIHYDNRGAQAPAGAAQPATPRPQPAAGAQRATGSQPGAADGGVKRLECEGPVTVTSEDQVATGQRAVFDREKDLVVMTGQVALAKGQNVTRGERLIYNTKTGIANIEGGRVQGFFVPGSENPAPATPRRPGAAAPTN